MYELREMINYVLMAVAIAVVAMWGWRILELIWLKPKRMEKHLKSQGYCANHYKVLFGDFKEFSTVVKAASSTPISLSDDIVKRVVPFLHKIANTYGKKTFMWFGYIPRVYIFEPEIVREILSKNFKYVKPKTNPLIKLLVNGLTSYEHDEWDTHRKIIAPAFYMEKLKLMLPAFHTSCVEVISALEKEMEVSKEVDVWPHIKALTADVISRTAFGSSYQEGMKIFHLLTIQTELVMEAASSLYIPGMRFLPTKSNRRMKKIAKEMNNLLTDIIIRRIQALKSGESTNEDLLGIILESNFKDVFENGKTMGILTINQIVEECKLFYLAGQETTGDLLNWTMVLLAQHQGWQERAREEVFQVFGKDNKPDFDGLNRLKIVTMILNEVLRLYPSLPEINRSNSEDTKLGDSLHLQAGTMITIPVILIHRDTEIWGEDANEFNPERFAEGILNVTKGQHSYFPFSSGRRVCLGYNFAFLEAKMALSMILRRFSFELSPSYTHAPFAIITIQPQFGTRIVMHNL